MLFFQWLCQFIRMCHLIVSFKHYYKLLIMFQGDDAPDAGGCIQLSICLSTSVQWNEAEFWICRATQHCSPIHLYHLLLSCQELTLAVVWLAVCQDFSTVNRALYSYLLSLFPFCHDVNQEPGNTCIIPLIHVLILLGSLFRFLRYIKKKKHVKRVVNTRLQLPIYSVIRTQA